MDMNILWKVTIKSSLLLEYPVEQLELFGDYQGLGEVKDMSSSEILGLIISQRLWDLLSSNSWENSLYNEISSATWEFILDLFFFPFSNYTYSANPQYSGGCWKISVTFPPFGTLQRQYFAGGLHLDLKPFYKVENKWYGENTLWDCYLLCMIYKWW